MPSPTTQPHSFTTKTQITSTIVKSTTKTVLWLIPVVSLPTKNRKPPTVIKQTYNDFKFYIGF